MPGKLRRNEYDLVEEAYDSKSPVHNEDAFEHGIVFRVKYIGTKEIQKPSSRAEIVTSMRRIRYEHKVYGTKKTRTELSVSVSGIKVVHKEDVKRGWITHHKKKDFVETEVMHYPINRIFYVSHDSQDLQIFSFISKDDDIFKCSVFKASNKADAVHIVRTVGQAFEVCHKRTLSQTEEDNNVKTEQNTQEVDGAKTDAPMETEVIKPAGGQMNFSSDVTGIWTSKDGQPDADPGIAPLTIQQLRQIYQQQLDHQRQETQAAQAQIKLLTQQLDSEAAARQLLQSQLDQVLKQNKDLIATITQLVDQVQTMQNQMRGHVDSGVSLSLDMDGKMHSQASLFVGSSPVKDSNTSGAAVSKRQLLGEPVFPTIPPPAVTPSPVMSHRSEMEALDGSISSLQSSSKVASAESFLRSGAVAESSPLPTLVDLSASDLEMVEPRHEPFPQQFLQFVFDNSSNSEPGRGTSASNGSLTQFSGVSSRANTSLPQNNSVKSPVLNGNS
ncbi:carboxyl-terminal PDZ ligand of neuronal nitric oxide synthase protein-like [Orbicella faveolata]|uniref:carboxyl-terminal PDZ ligand of neuronal nitric oxide synthase protein-like n=1 Tax=Orbicella faveolata TaxID=48498 RepID=UPI0009E1D37B|nr:carboxyl-terminal PDZ ligand of neuronal nitric oxide synthase protein-like [Orbicella faveolata]